VRLVTIFKLTKGIALDANDLAFGVKIKIEADQVLNRV
jgi:hypothetical protein